MIDDILSVRKKKHVQDLNIVPILDMLTTVIFFLLMSTSFIEYTKLTLPPAGTSSSKETSPTPPVAAKIMVKSAGSDEFITTLSWGGEKPGTSEARGTEANLREAVRKQIDRFAELHPGERTLQISMAPSIPYQILIHVMDGARDHLPDPVLIGYSEAEGR